MTAQTGAAPSSLLPAAGLAFYLALLPLRMWQLNRLEVAVEPALAVLAGGVIGLAAMLLWGAFHVALGAGGRRRLARVLLALLAAVFLYDNLLFFLIPDLDGSVPAVANPWFWAFDLAWLGLLAWSLARKPAVAVGGNGTWARPAVAFMLLVPVLGLVANALLERSVAPRADRVDFTLSPDFNVVHILLDAMQSTEFPAALDALPDPEVFDGFTWFRNTVGASYKTDYSLPTIFTGRPYTAYAEFERWYRGESDTLMDAVAGAGYRIMAGRWLAPRVPEGMLVFHPPALAGSAPRLRDLGYLLDVALIRIAPFVLKNAVLDDYRFRLAAWAGDEALQGNEIERAAFRRVINALRVDPDQQRPSYLYLHLIYPHAPYTHRPDCSYAGEVIRPNPGQARLERVCALRDIALLLQRLRDLGALNRTLVVLQSDTGESHLLRPESLAGSGLPRRVAGGSPFAWLAIRPAGATGDLRISDLPASMQDVASTVLGQLGVASPFGGHDLFFDPPPPDRPRWYWAAEQGTFEVVGDMYSPSAWRRLSEPGEAGAVPLAAGTRLGFGLADASGLDYLGAGWDRPLADGINATWPESRLLLHLPADARSMPAELWFEVGLLFENAAPVAWRLGDGEEQPIEWGPVGAPGPERRRFRVPLDGARPGEVLALVIRSENPRAQAGNENDLRFNKSFFSFRLYAVEAAPADL